MTSSKLIYICGLIGAGKSTIVKKFEDYSNIVLEPLDKMLPLLSNPINKNISKLQYLMLDHHYSILNEFDKTNNTIIIEGSPEDNMIFATLSNMTKNQLKKYKKEYIRLIKKRNKYSYIKIYLHINTITALKRIKNRNRECEKWITVEYLNKLYSEQIKKVYNDIFYNYTLFQQKINIKAIIEML